MAYPLHISTLLLRVHPDLSARQHRGIGWGWLGLRRLRRLRQAKDSERATASMLGAKSGFVEGLRMIMACGGRETFEVNRFISY